MIDRGRFLTLTGLALMLLGAAGCGQMGPLYLPDETADGEEDQSDDENE